MGHGNLFTMVSSEDTSDLQRLETELAAVDKAISELESDVTEAVKESSGSTGDDIIKEKNEKVGELVVKLTSAKAEKDRLEARRTQIHSKYVAENTAHVRSEKLEHMKEVEIDTCSIAGQRSFEHTSLTWDHKHPTVASKIAKPPKLKTGQDTCIFLDRFEQYIVLTCGSSYSESLDLRLLNLIENDKAYRKFRSILAGIGNNKKLVITEFVAAIRAVLYPEAESRTLRDALYRLKQESDENAEEFSLRIEEEASKAFSQEPALKNEASLSALCNGLRNVEVRRKLKESELKSFDAATRLAIKHEHILISTQEQEDTDAALQSDFNVLSISNNLPSSQSRDQGYRPAARPQSSPQQLDVHARQRPQRGTVVCWNCKRPGHIARYCRSPRSNQQITNQSVRLCGICHKANHYTNQCWHRYQDRRDGTSNNGTSPRTATGDQTGNPQNNRLNYSTAGEFTVHPSRIMN